MPPSSTGASAFQTIMGFHPGEEHPFGRAFIPNDGLTVSAVPYRDLSEKNGVRNDLVTDLREMVTRHHASPEQLARSMEAKKQLGFAKDQKRLNRFPTNPATRKGNLAEVVLAEYLVATTGSTIPVYRLRYNQNVDQSLKGDDILAFDLDSNPIRIIVGEAKFREISSNVAVKEIVEGLVRSHHGGIPASLQFVADRLFESGQNNLGNRVMSCAALIANNNLLMDYVGFLMSDTNSARRVKENTPAPTHRLAMISMGLASAESLIAPCYDGLE
ncbi:MAG: DUF1837 domain-containing protein [Magnetococcales bacterium]|nr:DUF1837 domain-containing protein [Magnetococcales bacterium]